MDDEPSPLKRAINMLTYAEEVYSRGQGLEKKHICVDTFGNYRIMCLGHSDDGSMLWQSLVQAENIFRSTQQGNTSNCSLLTEEISSDINPPQSENLIPRSDVAASSADHSQYSNSQETVCTHSSPLYQHAAALSANMTHPQDSYTDTSNLDTSCHLRSSSPVRVLSQDGSQGATSRQATPRHIPPSPTRCASPSRAAISSPCTADSFSQATVSGSDTSLLLTHSLSCPLTAGMAGVSCGADTLISSNFEALGYDDVTQGGSIPSCGHVDGSPEKTYSHFVEGTGLSPHCSHTNGDPQAIDSNSAVATSVNRENTVEFNDSINCRETVHMAEPTMRTPSTGPRPAAYLASTEDTTAIVPVVNTCGAEAPLNPQCKESTAVLIAFDKDRQGSAGVEVKQTTLVDLTSSKLLPRSWPADARQRARLFKLPPMLAAYCAASYGLGNSDSAQKAARSLQVPGTNFTNTPLARGPTTTTPAAATSMLVEKRLCRVVYIPLTCLRVDGNAALAMAAWISTSLSIPLEIVTFVEEAVCTDVLSMESADSEGGHISDMRKSISRCAALCDMEISLKEAYGLDLVGYCVNSNEDIPSMLCDRFSTHNSENALRLIVIVDDSLHPALDRLYERMANGSHMYASAARDGHDIVGGGDATSAPEGVPTIEVCIGFDSASVHPCRELQRTGRTASAGINAAPSTMSTPQKPLPSVTEQQQSLAASENVDAKVALLLNALHQQFDVMCTSASSLLAPSVSEKILKTWADSDCRSPDREFDTTMLANKFIHWDALRKCCDLYYTLITRACGTTPERCGSRCAAGILSNILTCWTSLSLTECIDISASSFPSTKHTKKLFHLWDMFSAWAVLSPLQIAHSVRPHPNLWKTVVRPMLLHFESCRLVFLTKYQEAERARGQSSACSPLRSFCMADILSQRALTFLTEKWNWAMKMNSSGGDLIDESYPNQMMNGYSGDNIYDAIQASLIMHGVCPAGIAGKYWTAYIFTHCQSGSSTAQLALLQIVSNCSHMIEYSTWPIAYTCSLIESIVSAVSKTDPLFASAEARIMIQSIQERALADLCKLNGGVERRRFLQAAAAACLT